MTYNLEGKRISLENLAGQITTTAWDCCHKVSETQPDGSTTTWDYDAEGRMVASSRLIPLDMTNVTWLTTCYEYDDLGRQVATWQTNYAAQIGLPPTRTRYDALGRVVARVDTLGNTTTTSYSPDGRTVFVHNPNASTRITTRSANGNLLSVTGSAVMPEFHTYGITNLCVATASSPSIPCRVHETRYGSATSARFTRSYENLLGQTIRDERSGFQGAVLATTHSYDSFGRLVSTATDYEPTVEYAYDTLGNRVTTTRCVGGSPSSATAAEWRRTETRSGFILDEGFVWLAQTNILSCSDVAIAPLVSSSARQLTGLTPALPSRSRSTDVRGNVTESELLVSNSLVTSRQSLPYAANKPLSITRYGVLLMDVSVSTVTNTYVYDVLGRCIAHIDGRGNTRSFDYGVYDTYVGRSDFLGNRTVYVYNQYGMPVLVTNALGNVAFFEFDHRGRRIYEGGVTYPVRYAYDIFGNVTSMITYHDETQGRSSGDITTYSYDESTGNLLHKTLADGKGTTFAYTPDGKLSKQVWARGVSIEYDYDCWGNLTSIAYSDTTPSVSICYNVLGLQTNVQDSSGVVKYFYSENGYLTNETFASVSETNSIDRYWDDFGRSLGYSLNGARQTTIGYDVETGRIQSMVATGSTNAFYWSYIHGTDLKSQLSYPNGMKTLWQYDANYQLTQICNSTLTNILSKYEYMYDAGGRCVQEACFHNQPSASYTNVFCYNERDELIAVTNAAKEMACIYEYDDIGNRVTSCEKENASTNVISKCYCVNNLNQYTQITNSIGTVECDFQYDDDGNQIKTRTSTGVWNVSYNAENRPVRWASTSNEISMCYDYAGRRVRKNCLRFVYNGYLQISDNTNNVYVWDPTESVLTHPLVWKSRGEQLYYLICNGNKSVSDIIPAKEEVEVASTYQYAPFGDVFASNAGAENVCPFRFSCEYADDDLGLVYYNFRHYAPDCGRWMCRDSMAKKPKSLSFNYMYVGNQPFRYIDVLGDAAAPIARPARISHPSQHFRGSKPNSGKKPNPGNRRPTPPAKTPSLEPIEPKPAETKDTIEGVGNALDKMCNDHDLNKPKDIKLPEYDYKYEHRGVAASYGYNECVRIYRSKEQESLKERPLSSAGDRGMAVQISPRKCRCCEVMIAKRSWCFCDSLGEEYAMVGLNFYEDRSCEQIKNQAKLLPAIPRVSFSFDYYDF